MKRISVLLLVVLLAGGCTKESAHQPGGQGVGTASPGGGPVSSVITHAEISSSTFLSDQPLSIQYSADGAIQPGQLSVRWIVDGALVDGVMDTMLDPQNFHKGSRVEAELSVVDGSRQGAPFRVPPVIVKNSPPVVTTVSLNPVPAFVGTLITAVAEGSDHDGDPVTFTYQWLVNGRNVPGAEAAQFNTEGLKKKDTVTALVTPFDGEDRGSPVSTKYLTLSNRNPDITSTPTAGLQDGVYSYQVTASDADGDPISFSLATAPPGMTIGQSTGLIRWQPNGFTGKQQITVKVAAEDDDGGTAYQEFSMTFELQ